MPNKNERYEKIKLPDCLYDSIDVVYEDADWAVIDSADSATGIVPSGKFTDEQMKREYARGVVDKAISEQNELYYVINPFKKRIACMIEAPEWDAWCSLPEKEAKVIRAFLTDSKRWWEGKKKTIQSGKVIEKRVYPKEKVLEIMEQLGPEYYFNIHQCDCNAYYGGCARKSDTCIKWKKGKPPINSLQDRGIVKCSTKEEAIEAFKRTDERGLVHVLSASGMCNCCGCCCINLRNRDDYPVKELHQLYYVAYVDADSCIDCEQCVPRCNFRALKSQDGHMTVNPKLCWGCGVCRAVCPTGALRVRELETPVITDQSTLL